MALVRRVNFYGLLTLAALVLLWQLALDSGLVALEFMASPSQIVDAIGDLAASGELATNVLHTLWAVLIGWAIAVVVGVIGGTALGLSAVARSYSMATVDLLRALPIIALIPPAVLVFGFALKMEIAVIVYACVWPVTINAAGGILAVSRELRDVARTFHLRRMRTAFSVVLPAALPAVIVGARLAMSLALIIAVVAEMVGNPTGLGYALVFAQQAIDPPEMFAYVIVIGLLGVVLNGALTAGSRLLAPVRAAAAEAERR
jgi:sulfonate transport system permease protein